MKKQKLHSYPIIGLFMAFLVAVLVMSLMTEPQDYNSREEKELAQHPRIYACSSFDEFTAAWEAFVNDQFPGRNEIITAKQESEINSEGDAIVNEVYVLSNDYLFAYTYPTQNKDVQKLMEAITSKRADSALPFTYIVVPQKNLILAEQEPTVDITIDENNTTRLISALNAYGIPKINCCDYIRSFPLEERANFFYKTDFHWNEYGAYVAADYIAQNLAATKIISKTSIPTDNDFIWSDLTGLAYLGDLQKRFSEEVTVEEYIPFYVAVDGENFKYYTELNGEEVPRNTIVASGINTHPLDYNKLSIYNLGYLRVENPNAAEDKHVLILKDSYECCLTDYFSEMFSEIDIVDPRSDCPSFDEIVEARGIDQVLMIYHNSNVSQELIKYLSK